MLAGGVAWAFGVGGLEPLLPKYRRVYRTHAAHRSPPKTRTEVGVENRLAASLWCEVNHTS